MNPSDVPQSWLDLQADLVEDLFAPRPGLEDLYEKLEAALVAAADLVAVAQQVLPDDVSLTAFVALSELCRLKLVVNPGPSDQEPF